MSAMTPLQAAVEEAVIKALEPVKAEIKELQEDLERLDMEVGEHVHDSDAHT